MEAKVKFKRGNKAFIDNLPIVDGQLVYNTDAGNYYMDVGNKRISGKDYVAPEMFGAVGDGVSDDSDSLESALAYSMSKGSPLLLKGKYYITKPLLKDTGETPVVLNIIGNSPDKSYIYELDEYGGIVFKNGINVFENAVVRGSIKNCSIMPKSRSTTGSIFYNCHLSAFSFEYCNVSNVLAFCWNSTISSVSQIKNNRFLTVYYFAKCDGNDIRNSKCTDSFISGNYINGGDELNDNVCFEWQYFNGSNITSNFIDYYRTIYRPFSATSFSFQGPVSAHNQYQVFRYLYEVPENVNGFEFSSNCDSFNWTDPSTNEKLRRYKVENYEDKLSGESLPMPPYIMRVNGTEQVSVYNAVIQSNCASLVFVYGSNFGYTERNINFTVCGYLDSYSKNVSEASKFYNVDMYKYNLINLPFVEEVSKLPTLPEGWATSYPGKKVKYKGKTYRYVCGLNPDTGANINEWVDISAFV